MCVCMISLYTSHEKKRYKGLMLNISYIEKEIDKNHIRWKCRPRKNTVVIMVQKVLTNTSHVPSCIVMLENVITVSLLQKGHNHRIRNVAFVFNGIHWPMYNFEVSATIIANSSSAHTITLPAPKRSDSYTHWSVEHSPYLRTHDNVHCLNEGSEHQDSSLNRMCC